MRRPKCYAYEFTGCKKGARDCVYPEPSTSSKGGGSSKSTTKRASDKTESSSDESEDDAGPARTNLEAIPDEDETSARGMRQSSSGLKSTTRHSSEIPALVQDKGASPTPLSEGSVGYGAYQTVGTSRGRNLSSPTTGRDSWRPDWSHLPPDLNFYLTYFYENITYLHYSLKYDSGNFLKTLFIGAALRDETLLYAVVGFSAFQRTLHNPEGQIEDFLQYYDRAVTLLLTSLRTGERRSSSTLLAILQLATIEVRVCRGRVFFVTDRILGVPWGLG